jgi:tetratricopeptide (TPR) repeat protein
MALAYTQMGKFEDALAASQRAMILIGQDPDTLSTLGVVYARANKQEDAKWITESLKELSMKRYVPPYLIALIYCALGDNDQAFAWLEKAVQRHDSYILRVKVEPVLDGLRSDVRYDKLLRSINF